jgi:addiction module HigA family antidote
MAKEKKLKKNKAIMQENPFASAPFTIEKLSRLKELSSEENNQNALISIRYRMEYYLLSDSAQITKIRPLEEFLQYFLQALDLSFRSFAQAIRFTDTNLNKYLHGSRKFNLDLAMKFGAFFHTPPELWLGIQAKNDVMRLRRDEASQKKYAVYDYLQLKTKRGPATG